MSAYNPPLFAQSAPPILSIPLNYHQSSASKQGDFDPYPGLSLAGGLPNNNPVFMPQIQSYEVGPSLSSNKHQRSGRTSKEGSPPEKKKTRNRKPASCAPCRKKKLRCDRLVPCSACQGRGEAHLCSWENAVPLYLARDMNDMAELRGQVDRLQSLVDALTNPSNGNSLVDETQKRILTDEKAPRNSHPQEEVDLKANDICEALSHLAISQLMKIDQPSGDKVKENQIVDEAKNYCAALPQTFGLSNNLPSSGSDRQASRGLSRLSYAGDSANIKDALKNFPSAEQANSALTYYFSYVDWYLHPVHTPTFHFQMQRLREAVEKNPDDVDPFFLSVYLALCGVGLAMMPPRRAQRDGFRSDKDNLANSWLEASMIALSAGRFLDNPTLDAIRALIIINAYFVFMATGESVNAGISILTMAVQLAIQIGLNRDPDRTDQKPSYLEAEDRRRVFWTLFHLITLSSSSLGRTWTNFDMDTIDVKLPDDVNDEEFSKKDFKDAEQVIKKSCKKETVMTSVLIRIRIAQVAVKISKKAFGIKGVTYSEIFQLDAQIREIETNLPSFYTLKFEGDDYSKIQPPSPHVTASEMRTYMIWIGLAQEYIRIHRPYLILGYHNPEYAYSRSQCLKYSKIILAISRMPAMKQKWGGLTYKIISAAVILGIELLQNPEAPDAKHLKSDLLTAKERLASFSDESSIARRGAKILQFLEGKLRLQRESNILPSSKKTRTSSCHVKTPLEQALSSSVRSADEEEASALPHKAANHSHEIDLSQISYDPRRHLSDGESSTTGKSQMSSPSTSTLGSGLPTEYTFQFQAPMMTPPNDPIARSSLTSQNTFPPPTYRTQHSQQKSTLSPEVADYVGSLHGLENVTELFRMTDAELYRTLPSTTQVIFQPIPAMDAGIYVSPMTWNDLGEFTAHPASKLSPNEWSPALLEGTTGTSDGPSRLY